MKKSENFAMPAAIPASEKTLRPGSKAHLESLKTHLNEILEWELKIKNAKGKEAQVLRKEFKDKYDITFNVKLMEKLTGESRSLENVGQKDEKPAEVIEMKVAEMNKMVADDIVKENTEAEQKDVDKIPEFNKEANQIDAKREAVVDEVVAKAGALVVGEKGLDREANKGPEINEKESLEEEITSTKEKVLDEIENSRVAELKAAALEAEEAAEEAALFEEMEEKNNKKEVTQVEVVNAPLPETEGVVEKYPAQVVESFKKLALSPEDLETVPGLVDLPEAAQLMIAKSLQAMAFEGAKNKVVQEGAQKMQNKGFFRRMGQGIVNSFKSKRLHREALEEQKEGGLEKHGANLVNMVDWAKTFIPSESINAKGEKQLDFISIPPHFEPNDEERVVFDDFNNVAMTLASLPKHDLVSVHNISENSPEYEKALEYQSLLREYREKQEEIKIILSNHAVYEKEINLSFLEADAKLNMMQFLSADPNLEKEWNKMLKKDSALWGALKGIGRYFSSKDNLKFFAGGALARKGVSLAFVSTMGTAAGAVAIPLVAATIGAWRGKERAKKQLREKDKFVDKKTLYDHPVLADRKKALSDLAALQNNFKKYTDLSDEQVEQLKSGNMELASYKTNEIRAWNLRLNVNQMQQLGLLNEDEIKNYEETKSKFNKLDKKWQRTDNKNVEKKTLRSEDLTEKLEDLLKKLSNADMNNRDSIVGAIQRRLDFNKDLADRGLVNFGALGERNEKMRDFYNTLNKAQFSLFHFDYDNLDLSYERGANHKVLTGMEIVKAQERARNLIYYFEDKAGQKLDKKRRNFVVKNMVKGAVLGAVFAKAGSELFSYAFQGSAATAAAEAMAEAEATAVAAEAAKTAAAEATATAEAAAAAEAAAEAAATAETAAEAAAAEATATAEAAAATASDEPSSWSDVISNEGLRSGQHDSVWRSTREIFLSNAESLGYEGDEEGLAKWAEIQTNKALANSGEITVFEGNKVVLEKINDEFVVSVEQGEGLAPITPLKFVRVDSLPKMSPITSAQIIEGASSAASQGEAATIAENIISSAESIENSPTALAKWLANVGEKLSLAASEMAYVSDNIVKTVIGGQDIFLDPINGQYYFFNEAGEEISGFLINEQGETVSDVKEFLVEKFDLVSIDDVDGSAGEETSELVGNSDGPVSGGEEATEDVSSGSSNESADEGKDISETTTEAIGDEKKWNELNKEEQFQKIWKFLNTTEGLGLRSRANVIGMMINANSSLPVEVISEEALKQFSEATGIENLAENINDSELEELQNIIKSVAKGGFVQQNHGRALSSFGAKLIFSRGS